MAQSFAAEPKRMIYDERVSALEVTPQAQILDLPAKVQGEIASS